MRQQRSRGAGLGLARRAAGTFATSGTFARSLIEAGWSAEAAVAARVGVAALVLAAPAAWSLRGRRQVVRCNLGMIGLFGLLAVATAQACFFNAVQYLPIGVALLLEYLGIILVVGWMWVAHGQRPRRLAAAEPDIWTRSACCGASAPPSAWPPTSCCPPAATAACTKWPWRAAVWPSALRC